MNLKQLYQQIQNNALANFYVVIGDEDILIQRAKQAFKAIIKSDDREMNFSQFDLSQQDLSEVIDDAMSLPFFGDRRVILIQNPEFLTAKGKISETNQDQLSKLIESPVADNVVVFLINDLKIDKRKKITKQVLKHAEQIELAALNESAAKQAITQQLQQQNYTMSPDAL